MAKLAGSGAIETDVGILDATFSVAVPLTLSSEALMPVEPGATAVPSPAGLTVAAATVDDDQVAVAVTLSVEPSL